MSQPVGISGSEAQDSSGGPPSASNASPKPTSSGRFQNLNAYLKANQNFNQQGGGLAGKVNQNLTSKSNDLQKNFAQSQQDYQTSLNNARQRYDSNFVDNTLKDPTKVSDADASKFAKMRDASYTGPTSLDPSLNIQASNFSNLAGNTGTEQGRFNLLQNLYNKPNYSSGQKTLDNLFLQNNPQQVAALQANKTTANQLNNNLKQAQMQAGIQSTDAINEANTTRDSTRNALTGAVTGFNSGMQDAIQKALSGRDAAYQNELTGLQNPNQGISSADASRFGLLQTLGDAKSMPIYDLDPGKYLQESNVAPTGQTVASADDYNKIQALQKLSGTYGNENISKVFDTYNNPSLAGSFAKESPYDFNQAAFKNDLNNVKGRYEAERDPIQVQLDNANYNFNNPLGLNYQLSSQANPVRSQMQTAYNQAKQYADAAGTTVEQLFANQPGGAPIDPTNMSDLDLLGQYKQETINSGDKGGTTGEFTNPYSSFLDKYKTEDQNRTNRQGSLDQLLHKYAADRYVGINDANQYQPTQIAGKGAGDIHSSPEQEPTSNYLAALNNIYNR